MILEYNAFNVNIHFSISNGPTQEYIVNYSYFWLMFDQAV